VSDPTTSASWGVPAGSVAAPTVAGLPPGYASGVTRYADVILREAFPGRFADLVAVLDGYRIGAEELLASGGNRAPHTARFDAALQARGWGKRNVTIAKMIDDRLIHTTRGHEIDMFGPGSSHEPYPGIAVEMEWNNKDPFFDRDLLNYQALHREGALAVGVVVTRGPELQRVIGPTIRLGANSVKFGQSTTHWTKLVSRVDLGGGGECPLLLVGIEPDRVTDFEPIRAAHRAGRQLSPRSSGDTLTPVLGPRLGGP
jgi:hypothetical protein